MHGLVNRSIQCFLRDTYGEDLWLQVARDAGLGFDSFETMLNYDDRLTAAVIDAAARRLDRPRDTVMEDLGTYLVSHPNLERVRRLMRFGGVGFVDFLHSLDDLPGRARLALPDLELPRLTLEDDGCDRFTLRCTSSISGAGHVVLGLLRAMADDYGALVLLDHSADGPDTDLLSIHLLESQFAAGRSFELAQRAG
jgi:Haem-NO-binding